MAHFTDNPVLDGQDHIGTEENTHDYDYQCDACGEGFDHGHGVRIHDEKFCNTCIDNHEQIEFYRNHGLTVFEIYEATNSSVSI